MEIKLVDVPVFTEEIALDRFLKWIGIAETGGHAKLLIQDGQVRVNGAIETKRSRKLSSGDIVCLDQSCFRIVMEEQE